MPKNFVPQDQYFKKAKELGYRARSAFKLAEIQDKFKILKPGMGVLDLGAAPGSWLQYASKIVGPKAEIVGIDLMPIKKLAQNIITIEADIFSDDVIAKISLSHPKKFDLILSDMAPKTSGVKTTDHARSIELNQRVLALSKDLLAPNGTLVLKVFQGSDFQYFFKKLKTRFKSVKTFKPKASRDRSFEIYVICR